ncbi:MAG: ribosomal RNA small subunit methyltransferase A [Ignavibacteriae bacterium]|nr:MAG: ribosomal RNA small subunit methyltransferase A [Ignavibacteriota bacterium]
MPSQNNRSYPKKNLGQNYLKDENICRNVADAFIIKQNDIVLEIGAGEGALTKYLTGKTNHLAVVELDKRNVEILKFKFPGLKIIQGDILKTDFKEIANLFPAGKLRVIGNIPYYITSEILFKLIDNRDIISDAQIMMQEEVAQRLAAKPNSKTYGILSILVHVYSQPELLFKVSANCFYPKPNVDSRVVHVNFEKNLTDRILDINFFKKFVKTSFGTRRKTLRNSLKNMGIDTNTLNLDFDFIRRAETLSVDEFIKLSNTIYQQVKLKQK